MEAREEKMNKKKVGGFAAAVVALTLIVGSWAYYSSINTIDNELNTSAGGGTSVTETFPGNENWKPGEKVTKKLEIKNTGDIPLVVRVKMSEKWTPLVGASKTIDSSQAAFYSATASTSNQEYATDGLIANDESVVYKNMTTTNWTDAGDGYWYYNIPLAGGASVSDFLSSITLAGDADTGLQSAKNYYTKSSMIPADDNIGTNENTQWVEYTGSVPTGSTHNRSVTSVDPGYPGYSDAKYVLSITTETLQATTEAIDGTPAWAANVPISVRNTFWGF